VALRGNVLMPFGLAILFVAIMTIFQMRLTRAREAQKKTRHFLQNLTEHMGEGLYAIDPNGVITFINQEATRLSGYSEQECLQRNAHELFHVNDEQHGEQGCSILRTVVYIARKPVAETGFAAALNRINQYLSRELFRPFPLSNKLQISCCCALSFRAKLFVVLRDDLTAFHDIQFQYFLIVGEQEVTFLQNAEQGAIAGNDR